MFFSLLLANPLWCRHSSRRATFLRNHLLASRGRPLRQCLSHSGSSWVSALHLVSLDQKHLPVSATPSRYLMAIWTATVFNLSASLIQWFQISWPKRQTAHRFQPRAVAVSISVPCHSKVLPSSTMIVNTFHLFLSEACARHFACFQFWCRLGTHGHGHWNEHEQGAARHSTAQHDVAAEDPYLVNTAYEPQSSFTTSPHSTTRPLYVWNFLSNLIL